MKKLILLITLLTSLNLYSQDAMSNYMDIINNSNEIMHSIDIARMDNEMLRVEVTDAFIAADVQLQTQIDTLTASLSSLQSSVTTNSASINDIVVNTSIPSSAVVIPTDASGPVQIILESSQDMINWNAANPGTYGASESERFYRVRAVQQ
ncbi:MAG: hypothetical protein ACJZ9L_03735 [Coraliomargaritaceae bacterium]